MDMQNGFMQFTFSDIIKQDTEWLQQFPCKESNKTKYIIFFYNANKTPQTHHTKVLARQVYLINTVSNKFAQVKSKIRPFSFFGLTAGQKLFQWLAYLRKSQFAGDRVRSTNRKPFKSPSVVQWFLCLASCLSHGFIPDQDRSFLQSERQSSNAPSINLEVKSLVPSDA